MMNLSSTDLSASPFFRAKLDMMWDQAEDFLPIPYLHSTCPPHYAISPAKIGRKWNINFQFLCIISCFVTEMPTYYDEIPSGKKANLK